MNRTEVISIEKLITNKVPANNTDGLLFKIKLKI